MDHSNHLAMSHDPVLVIISWAVAVLAAFAALNTLDRLRKSSEHRAAWLWSGAVAFGLGVWAMHFTAMSAMSLGMTVSYDPALTARMAPSLARVAGPGALRSMPPGLAAEDFAYFSSAVPGVFFNVGVTAPGTNPREAPSNHSPRFRVDESGLLPGLRAMLHMVADYTGSGVA